MKDIKIVSRNDCPLFCDIKEKKIEFTIKKDSFFASKIPEDDYQL